MKKILILLLIINSISFSKEQEIEKTEIEIKQHNSKRKVAISDDYIDTAKKEIIKIWKDTIKKSYGTAHLKIIIKTRKGTAEKIKIYSKKGSRFFRRDLKKFNKRLLEELRLKRFRYKTEFIDIYIKLKKEKIINNKIDPISLYKDNSKEVYKNYITYLINEKNYSKKIIQRLLNAKKKTLTQTMLNAIYYDYTLNDINKASEYYDIIINAKSNRFKGKVEALYLEDYLLREEEYRLMLKLLPEYSCEVMKDKYKYNCYYYRAQALYFTENPDYIISLTEAKKRIPQAKILEERIKNLKKGRVLNYD